MKRGNTAEDASPTTGTAPSSRKGEAFRKKSLREPERERPERWKENPRESSIKKAKEGKSFQKARKCLVESDTAVVKTDEDWQVATGSGKL